jgi:putative aminopeptidase FrvX
VHDAPGLNDPAESLLKPTVPVGVTAVPEAVSVTVAVHVEACPTATDPGEHDTPVELERGVIVIVWPGTGSVTKLVAMS